MYRDLLILSVVVWTVVLAIILSTPRDVRRTVHLLGATRGRTVDLTAAPESKSAGINEETRPRVVRS